MKKKLLLVLAAMSACGGMSAQKWEWTSETPVAGNSYYLYAKVDGLANRFLNVASGFDAEATVLWTVGGSPVSAYTLTSAGGNTVSIYNTSPNSAKPTITTNETKSGDDINLTSDFDASNGTYTMYRTTKMKYKVVFELEVKERNVEVSNTGVMSITKNATSCWMFISQSSVEDFNSNKSAFNAYVASYNALKAYKENPACADMADEIQGILDANNSVNASTLATKASVINNEIKECIAHMGSALAGGTDVTGKYIQNPGFDNMTGWTLNGFQQKKNEAKFGNSNCVEIWSNGSNNEKKSGKLSQVLGNLPAGSYTLSVTGWGSFGDNTDCLYAKVGTAEPVKTDMPGVDGDPVNTYSVDFQTDGISSVEIGIQRTENIWWTAVDNFTLTYKGESANLSVKDGKYSTFVAPFDVTLPAGVTAYTVTINAKSVTLNPVGGDVVVGGNPVILKNESGSDVNENYVGVGGAAATVGTGLVGVLATSAQITSGNYLLQTKEGVQQFHKYMGSDFAGTKNRCYIDGSAVPANVKSLLMDFDGEETSIEELFGEQPAQKPVFDLSGRKVSRAQKGIYIIGGKKVVK